MVEYGRTRDATTRVARSLSSIFNPMLNPDLNRRLKINQEEIRALTGISRQNANQCLNRLERDGLISLDYGGVTIIALERLRAYCE